MKSHKVKPIFVKKSQQGSDLKNIEADLLMVSLEQIVEIFSQDCQLYQLLVLNDIPVLQV